jgi:hypothetical protein
MSAKGARAKVVSKTIKDPELVDMFNKMVGASDPDPQIVIPKYERIFANTKEVVDILDKFSKSPCARVFSPLFGKGFKEIEDFVTAARPTLLGLELEQNDKVLSGEDLHSINTDPTKLTEFLNNMNNRYKTTQLGPKYTNLRECPPVKEMIMLARNLKNALITEKDRKKSTKHDLEDKSKLSDDFIVNSDGDYLRLFNFTFLDFKQLFISDLMTDAFKNYILLVLHYIYLRVITIVKDITSPDIDVEKFSEILVRNIDEMRKHIPRCDKAFDKIKQSVGLLKNNFGGYYKDFVTSQNGNPGIIVENFVLDVAKDSKADLQTARQFKMIVAFYRQQMASRKINDPRIRKMMALVGENLDILETKMDPKKRKPEATKASETPAAPATSETAATPAAPAPENQKENEEALDAALPTEDVAPSTEPTTPKPKNARRKALLKSKAPAKPAAGPTP